jgi:hypothetical protein
VYLSIFHQSLAHTYHPVGTRRLGLTSPTMNEQAEINAYVSALSAYRREKLPGRNSTFVAHHQGKLDVGKGNIPEEKDSRAERTPPCSLKVRAT